MTTLPGEGVRVALYNGIYVQYDAISDSVRHKVALLSELREAGHDISWNVFTHYSDFRDDEVRVVPSVNELAQTPEFWDAQIHILEFGIAYDLFDAIHLIPRDRFVTAIYHNITPRSLVTDPSTLTALERSEVQQQLLLTLPHVACDSAFNQRELVALGMAPERTSLMHLPPALDLDGPRKQGRDDAGPVSLLYVGRMVHSKGVGDLLAAVRSLVAQGKDVSITFVGNTALSDAKLVGFLRDAEETDLSGRLVVEANATAGRLRELYLEADIMVLPSYHEGYCVTAVEAMHAGCFVVAYDAGNLPFVVGDLGALVPTGDVQALTAKLAATCDAIRVARSRGEAVAWPADRGPMSDVLWREALGQHLSQFRQAQYRDSFLALLSLAGLLLDTGPRSRSLSGVGIT